MKHLLLFAFSLNLAFCVAQDEGVEPELERYKIISINTTPLITQLIPFNRTNPQISGPYNVEFHRFRGSRAFHTSLGMFLASDDNFNTADNVHFNFRIGGEKRRDFFEKWSYYSGWDFYLSAGSFNLISDKSTETAVLGAGPRWSVGYNFNQTVSLSIETALVLGLDLDLGSIDFEFIPPIAINLNFTLPRR